MKILNVGMTCKAYRDGYIEVPDGLDINQAIEYAKNHKNNIKSNGNLEYIKDSEVIDEEKYNKFESTAHS